MDAKELQHRFEIGLAWARGERAQWRKIGRDVWNDEVGVDSDIHADPAGMFRPDYVWRLAPKPKLVPWTLDSFPKDRPVWVRLKLEVGATRNFVLVDVFGDTNVHCASHGWVKWERLLMDYVQHDGKPCGVEVAG